MKPFELLGQVRSPDGTLLKLVRRGDEYLILADGLNLMSSRMHGSEDALATVGCQHLPAVNRPRVLIGGLGMGFTLRAALDLLPPQATVVVAELVNAVVEWNRGPLGPLANHPLNDSRVSVQTVDVAHLLRSHANQFDAILLDVDNGPAAFTDSRNAGLYDARGITTAFSALKIDGVLAIWAAREDPAFAQRLGRIGFLVETARVRGRLKKGGPHHTVYVVKKSVEK